MNLLMNITLNNKKQKKKTKKQDEPEVGAPLDKQGGRWFLHSRID